MIRIVVEIEATNRGVRLQATPTEAAKAAEGLEPCEQFLTSKILDAIGHTYTEEMKLMSERTGVKMITASIDQDGPISDGWKKHLRGET